MMKRPFSSLTTAKINKSIERHGESSLSDEVVEAGATGLAGERSIGVGIREVSRDTAAKTPPLWLGRQLLAVVVALETGLLRSLIEEPQNEAAWPLELEMQSVVRLVQDRGQG
ncbi:hypothetical protein ACFX2I_007355 [Malus domestica]